MNIRKYDHGHSFGARKAERVIAVVCAMPASAQNRVPSPTRRNPPNDASSNSTVHAKIEKFGSTTCSTSHDHGPNTGYVTANIVQSCRAPNCGGVFHAAPPSQRKPSPIRTAANNV